MAEAEVGEGEQGRNAPYPWCDQDIGEMSRAAKALSDSAQQSCDTALPSPGPEEDVRDQQPAPFPPSSPGRT
ncbi:MAG TPA: hypothetical protein VEF71_20370 [Streptosporangiaceae bacterium]|nr:hypothetical protein [Streptosporangiaceae bacterium]